MNCGEQGFGDVLAFLFPPHAKGVNSISHAGAWSGEDVFRAEETMETGYQDRVLQR